MEHYGCQKDDSFILIIMTKAKQAEMGHAKLLN